MATKQMFLITPGHLGPQKHPDANKDVSWHVVIHPCKRKALDKKNNAIDTLIGRAETIKASIKAKGELAPYG